jgi:nucleoside-diphosphate-sugar epimerase
MRFVVVGASGNVGWQVLPALREAAPGCEIRGVARRVPPQSGPAAKLAGWAQADIAEPDARRRLTDIFSGADAVIHLAWLIQPSHDRGIQRRVNVGGTRAVAQAAIDVGVPRVVYASSVGAYSPGPKGRRVDESWPRHGVVSSTYSRHKAEVEAYLDWVERQHPELRVVRLRPALVFQSAAANEIGRYFAGPLLPRTLLRFGVPLVPAFPDMRFQCVHAEDVGRAYALAATRDVRGAFNIAAEPVIDAAELARILHGRPVEMSSQLLKALADVSWRTHLQPTEPGWVDLAAAAPLMDTTRARTELGWEPRHTAVEALEELIHALARNGSAPTPVLGRRRREPTGGMGNRLVGAVRGMISG